MYVEKRGKKCCIEWCLLSRELNSLMEEEEEEIISKHTQVISSKTNKTKTLALKGSLSQLGLPALFSLMIVIDGLNK